MSENFTNGQTGDINGYIALREKLLEKFYDYHINNHKELIRFTNFKLSELKELKFIAAEDLLMEYCENIIKQVINDKARITKTTNFIFDFNKKTQEDFLKKNFSEKIVNLVNNQEKASKNIYVASLYYFLKAKNVSEEEIFNLLFFTLTSSGGSFSQEYLMKTVSNKIIDLLNHNKKDKILKNEIKNEIDIYEHVGNIEDDIDYEEKNRIFKIIIDKILNKRELEIYSLQKFKDFTHEEIAEKLNITVKTVQNTFSIVNKKFNDYADKKNGKK